MSSFFLQTSGVRCLTFNPDGRTLLCGLHESLKVVLFCSCVFLAYHMLM